MQQNQIAANLAAALQIMDSWHNGMNCANGSCEPCSLVKAMEAVSPQPKSLDEIVAKANRRAAAAMSGQLFSSVEQPW